MFRLTIESERERAAECQHFSNNFSREFMSRLIVAEQRGFLFQKQQRDRERKVKTKKIDNSLDFLSMFNKANDDCAHSHKVHCSFVASTLFFSAIQMVQGFLSVRCGSQRPNTKLQLITSKLSLTLSRERVSKWNNKKLFNVKKLF